MKKVGLFISFLLVIGLIISGCTSPTLPQPTTVLKLWLNPEIVPYDPSNGWIYDGYVTVDGNEAVTLTSLDIYEKATENSSFVLVRRYDQADIMSWPNWKVHLSPGETITFEGGYAWFNETPPPYQKKYILYGRTDSGQVISAEATVTFLPK